MKRVMLLLVCIGCLGTAACLLSERPAWSDRFKSDFDTSVTLTRLRQSPESYLDVEVVFDVRYNRAEKDWTPFYTPFNAERFFAFSGWEIGNRVWVESERLDDFPFLFMRRDREDLQRVIEAPRYCLMRLFGKVRSTFNGVPWIEVFYVERRERSRPLTEALLRRLLTAEEHKNAQSLGVATGEFEWALGHRPPSDLAQYCHQELSKLYFLLENYDQCLRHAREALAENPDNRELQRIVDRAVENRAAMEAGREPLEPPRPGPAPVTETEPLGRARSEALVARLEETAPAVELVQRLRHWREEAHRQQKLIAGLEKRLARADEKVQALDEHDAELTRYVGTLKRSHELEVSRLQETLLVHEAESSDVAAELRRLRAAKRMHEQQLKEMQYQQGKLERTLRETRTELTTRLQRIHELEARLYGGEEEQETREEPANGQVEEPPRQSDAKLEGLRREVSQLQRRYHELLVSFRSQAPRGLQQPAASEPAAADRLRDLLAEKESLSDALADAREAVARLQAHLSEAENETEQYKSQAAALRKQLQAARQRLADRADEVAQPVTRELASLRRKAALYESALTEAQAEQERLREAVATLQDENRSLLERQEGLLQRLQEQEKALQEARHAARAAAVTRQAGETLPARETIPRFRRSASAAPAGEAEAYLLSDKAPVVPRRRQMDGSRLSREELREELERYRTWLEFAEQRLRRAYEPQH